ncbi:tRNA methyltransferase 10 homolog B [Cyrtonyx montezumae]|uniref:tRNA methyltransferase 10 homolog B n=1 Tax=Cyrtonyx montezumae TaxID=9017 RepID=UPI0032DB9066
MAVVRRRRGAQLGAEPGGRAEPAPPRPAAAMEKGGSAAAGSAPMELGLGLEPELEAARGALGMLRLGPPGEAPCSRNVLRKRRRWERVLAARRRRRPQERERSRARRPEGRGAARQRGVALAEERLLEARAAGPRLCVDLGVADRMTAKETSRLAAQIRRLYGANRQSERPFWLCLTEFVAGSPIHRECIRMNDGFSGYLMDTTPESYLDLFPLDAIVYLTPDSENVLEDIDPKKVYVLGGLVDESIHKNLTLRRAQEQSLQTARLPIREYMVKSKNTKNYHSETLAINQVFDVLSTYYKTQSWPDALKAGVSSGKGYVLPDGEK